MNVLFDCKYYVKYLGVLLGYNLSWKNLIEYVALKRSKTIGIISKIRHFGPFRTLPNIYQSLISPYVTYALSVLGQACKSRLNKILLLQKRALRFKCYLLRLNFYPYVHSLYYRRLSELMNDVNTASAPIKLRSLFMEISDVHSYKTRYSTSSNFSINYTKIHSPESVADY